MVVDLSKLPANLEPDFVLWRTGQGGAGEWILVVDPTAAGGRAIAQVSKDRTDYRFPLAVYKPYSGKDVEVSVRFKPVAGTVDEAGGIAVRLSTPGDYYVARANALEGNVRFYRVVKGQRSQIAVTVSTRALIFEPGKSSAWGVNNRASSASLRPSVVMASALSSQGFTWPERIASYRATRASWIAYCSSDIGQAMTVALSPARRGRGRWSMAAVCTSA